MNLDQIACSCASAVCQCSKPVLDQPSADAVLFETINIDILGTIFTVDKKKIMDNSTLISNALHESPLEKTIQLPAIQEYGGIKSFSYFIEFFKLEYFEIPKPLPERGAHFTKENCGNIANVEFINNFYDKSLLNQKKIPIELTNTLCMANYLGATNFLNWVAAKYASVLVELGLVKID